MDPLRAVARGFPRAGSERSFTRRVITYEAFAQLMDDYEAEHFARDAGSRRVADATLALLTTFRPRVPARVMDAFSRALMEDPLLDAFGYHKPHRIVIALARAGVKAHGLIERARPARRSPVTIEDLPWIRSYPHGFDIDQLGTVASRGGGSRYR